MEPFDTIDELRKNESFDGADVLRLRKLTTDYDDVAELWDFLGDVTQLADDGDLPCSEPSDCYLRAIKCDPTYAIAHESLAFYHDIFNEFDDAERHFRLAITHGAGDTSLIGLACILEQLGRHNEAESTMNECKDQSHPHLTKLRDEVADGLWTPKPDAEA